MITFSWKNIELSCHHSMYGKTDVAFAFTATLVATNDEGYSKEKEISGGFGAPGSSYTESNDITKADAISWIESALGDNLQNEKDTLESQLSVFKILRFE